jgi:hypothetical protein
VLARARFSAHGALVSFLAAAPCWAGQHALRWMRCHSNRAMNRRPESDRQPMIARRRFLSEVRCGVPNGTRTRLFRDWNAIESRGCRPSRGRKTAPRETDGPLAARCGGSFSMARSTGLSLYCRSLPKSSLFFLSSGPEPRHLVSGLIGSTAYWIHERLAVFGHALVVRRCEHHVGGGIREGNTHFCPLGG